MTKFEIITKILAVVLSVGISAAVLIMVVTFEAKTIINDNTQNAKDAKDVKKLIKDMKEMKIPIPSYIRKKRNIHSDPEKLRNIEMLQLTMEDPVYEDDKDRQTYLFNEDQTDDHFAQFPHTARKEHSKKRTKPAQTANINSLTYIFTNNSVYVVDRGEARRPASVYVYSWVELTTAAAASVGLSVTMILVLLLVVLYCTKSKPKPPRQRLTKLALNMRDLTSSVSPHFDEEKTLDSVVTKSYIQLERNPYGLYLERKNSKLLPLPPAEETQPFLYAKHNS